MTIFKNISNGKLYLLLRKGEEYIAMPYSHSGHTIHNCDIKFFIPIILGNNSAVLI